MPAKYERGAFVQFTEELLVPNVNIFSFWINPKKFSHTFTVAELSGKKETKAEPCGGKGKKVSNPLATEGFPGESFSLELEMDADDEAADGNEPVLASFNGLHSRLAALETLLYPVTTSGLGAFKDFKLKHPFKSLSFSKAGLTQGVFTKEKIPEMQLPTVLFVWGESRILPVRLTKLVITETEWDSHLNPTKASADVELEVLTPDQLASVNGPLKNVARSAYVWSQWQRQLLAVANEFNSYQWFAGILKG